MSLRLPVQVLPRHHDLFVGIDKLENQSVVVYMLAAAFLCVSASCLPQTAYSKQISSALRYPIHLLSDL